MTKHFTYIALVIIIGILLSCSRSNYFTSEPENRSSTEHYTTAYPKQGVSGQLQYARDSILRIVSTVFYNYYGFNRRFITLADIKTNNPKKIAAQFYSTEESSAGTSILLSYAADKVLLLTCNHVVSSPDSSITYFEGDNIPEKTYVKSISILQRQTNLIYTSRKLHSFEILASDPRNDLALLTAKIKDAIQAKPLLQKLAIGNSDDLQMGSFLYVLGYPKGYPMVTRGVASTTKNLNDRYFISDALFNPGISGGPVFATRDNFKTLEWVGMARSANASTEDVLVPRPKPDKYERAAKPYRDTVYVQQKTRISYGITQIIPVNTIKNFLAQHRQEISRSGFKLPWYTEFPEYH